MTTTQQQPVPSRPPALHITLGSKNPSKLLAVQSALSRLFPTHTHSITTHSVPSHVSPQPMSDDETIQGAINRAKEALLLDPEADYGIGIEGGTHTIPLISRTFESGWIAIIHSKSGKIGLGSSARFELSPKIVQRLKTGEELAEVIDDLSGQEDVRSGAGAMGILTNGCVNRDVAYAHGVFFAFAPFVSGRQYWE
ncbi:hypothetical protein HK097_000989 [Rhizophlyctis rosea]|uniref:inosine/xanthosine triphosphatase n=1 Tax=Rhizophlyctis rosea TaxID=64517 RepID=A0AAD5X123_9FUNG|nr:hypothetical protein HK097_000989 [Rhizophlyctis rosea]